MSDEERKYLYSEIDKFDIKLPLIVNLYCVDYVDYDGLIGKLSLINILYDKLLSRKILIRNEYGMLGNILYKYRDKIDLGVLLYLLDKDVKNLNLDDYCDYDLDEIKLNLEYSDFPFVCLNADFDFMGFDDLSKNKKIVLNALVKEDIHFKDIADYYDNDREIVMIALEQDGLNLEYVSDELKKIREIVRKAINKNGLALKFASNCLRADKRIVLEAIRQNGESLQYSMVINDREIELEAIKINPLNLEFVNESLKNDKKVVMDAVKNNALAIEYASDELKKTREIVLSVVENDGYALQYVDKQFVKDKEIVSKAVKSNGYAINFVLDEYIDDIDFLWNLLISNEENTFSNLSNEHFYKLKLEFERKYGVNDVRYIKLIDNEELYNRRRKIYY